MIVNNTIIYAHSKEGKAPEGNWQTLDDHAEGVAARAAAWAELFQSAAWAYNAAWLHDIGKVHPAFQDYLKNQSYLDDAEYDRGGGEKINHSSVGTALAYQMFSPRQATILAYLVAGHHAGLTDWYSSGAGKGALPERQKEGDKYLLKLQSQIKQIDQHIKRELPPPPGRKPELYHLWIRMLFSCLVDADFLDTEAFMQPDKSKERSGYPDLNMLKILFDKYMSDKSATAASTPVNATRQRILSNCRQKAQSAPGLFTLTVPTGGGKTLSSMAFALEHAQLHGKERIIYVIPYTSIIEQTADEFRKVFGYASIVEHHSNLDPDKETPRSRLASENWDAPIIITTNVQFFESLYASRPGRCRKLHNIVNSVVILDEAQMLPPDLILPCVESINHLTEFFNCTFLLMTATQPALPGLNPAREIIADPAALYQELKRVEIQFPENLQERQDWQSIAEELQKEEQVLCVVNTRKDCLDLHQLMPEDTIYLSGLLCGQHRTQIIKSIKEKLSAGDKIRVVSTQLVEAGVDIDFPVVYRALTGLDSIAQSAGRCNREGKLCHDGKLGRVRVFVPPAPAPRGHLLKGENTLRNLLASPEAVNTDDPDWYHRYFDFFYKSINDLGTKFHDLLVKDVNPEMRIAFRTAAKEFNIIDDNQYRSVLVRYGEGNNLIENLRQQGPHRQLMRQLQRYTVTVPHCIAARLLQEGTLEEVWEGILAQSFPSLYNGTTGLEIYKGNPDPEDLIK